MNFALPCHTLCEARLNAHIKHRLKKGWKLAGRKVKLHRSHLTCLTCLERRYETGKVNRNEYLKLEANTPFIIANGIAIDTLTKNQVPKYLLVNLNGSHVKVKLKTWFLNAWVKLCRKLTGYTTVERSTHAAFPMLSTMILPKRFMWYWFVTDWMKRKRRMFLKPFFSFAEVIANW